MLMITIERTEIAFKNGKGQRMDCRRCGKANLSDANFCSNCGFDLRTGKDEGAKKSDSDGVRQEHMDSPEPARINDGSNDGPNAGPNDGGDPSQPIIEVSPMTAAEDRPHTDDGFLAPPVKKRVVLGEYNYQGNENDANQAVFAEDAEDDIIYDRDMAEAGFKPGLLNTLPKQLLLLVTLVAIALGAFYGIKYINESRTRREEQLRIQEELRLAEEQRQMIQGYLTLTDGFISLSEKQLDNFNQDIEQLSKIETANWFKRLNLGKFFDSLVDTLMGMDSYTSLGKVSKEISAKLNSMNNPPDSLREIYTYAQKVSSEDKAITNKLTDQLNTKTYEELKEMVSSYSESIDSLKVIAAEFR